VLCGSGHTCGGTKSNATWTAAEIAFAPALDAAWRGLLNDPQTSGGLLVAVPPERAAELCDAALAHGAPCAEVIGEVETRGSDGPAVRFL